MKINTHLKFFCHFLALFIYFKAQAAEPFLQCRSDNELRSLTIFPQVKSTTSEYKVDPSVVLTGVDEYLGVVRLSKSRARKLYLLGNFPIHSRGLNRDQNVEMGKVGWTLFERWKQYKREEVRAIFMFPNYASYWGETGERVHIYPKPSVHTRGKLVISHFRSEVWQQPQEEKILLTEFYNCQFYSNASSFFKGVSFDLKSSFTPQSHPDIGEDFIDRAE